MGRMAFEIAKQNCEVKGISLSKNQINYCKKRQKELGMDNQVSFELVTIGKWKVNTINFFSWNV